MNPHELTDLKARCQDAKSYGRQIANAASHAATLEAVAGPVLLARGMVKHSATHLLALIEKVERVLAGEAPAEVTTQEADPEEPKKKSSKKSKRKKDSDEDPEADDDGGDAA
jgi:hypothetical protein